MPAIFISYSHHDEAWLQQLLKFLGGGLFQKQDLWSDKRIAVGQEWYAEIERAIQDAHVAILLISQDFLVSEFIKNEEVTALLRRRKNEGVQIFPLILRHSTWEANAWLKSMQARPGDGKPLDGRSRAKREKELAAFASEVANIVQPAAAQSEGERYHGKGDEPAQRNVGATVADLDRRTRESIAAAPEDRALKLSDAAKRVPVEPGARNEQIVKAAAALGTIGPGVPSDPGS